MPVKTAKVSGRRVLRFKTLDEMLADAQRLAEGDVRRLGNWSEGQIFKHLASTIDSAIDGLDYSPPWIIRIIARMMKKQFLTNTMKPGFQMPDGMKPYFMPPEQVSAVDGLNALRTAVSRLQNATQLAPSKIFGEMTREEVEQFQLRHAEMHLSFLVPERST